MANITGLVFIKMDESEAWDYLYLFKDGNAALEVLGKRLLELAGKASVTELLEYLEANCTEHGWVVLFPEVLSFDPDVTYGIDRDSLEIRWMQPGMESWQNEESLRKIIEKSDSRGGK